uniref:Uncharacterized protein n=1 Tax=Anguilla anguilla TaxID=7936 RepID=A0A0E9VI11_ANGAN
MKTAIFSFFFSFPRSSPPGPALHGTAGSCKVGHSNPPDGKGGRLM